MVTSSKLVLLLVCLFCIINPVIGKQNETQTVENKMFFSIDTPDKKEYSYTIEVLRELGKDPEYINKFVGIAKRVGIPLDQWFLGLKDSKIFTKDQAGYNDEQKRSNIELLKAIIAQQPATASENPSYEASPGAPGAGKTFFLIEKYNIDAKQKRFAPTPLLWVQI